MAIAFRSLTSTTYASRTNTTLTAPAGLADGDILIATVILGRGTAPTSPTPPAGWTEFGTATTVNDGSLFARLCVYWKRAASESGSYTFTHTTGNSQGLLAAYSGCLASGTPLGATSNNTGTASSSVGTGITTTAANSFLLYEAHDWTGGGALSPPSGMTERFDNLLYSADQLIVSAGATGNRTQTNGNAGGGDQWAARMVELLAATGGGTSTGTLGVTLDAVTLAGTGTVAAGKVQGRVTQASDRRVTEASVARITEGMRPAVGTADITLAAVSLTANGKVTVQGSAAGTLFPVVLVATGTVAASIATGTFAATLASLALSGSGTVASQVFSATLNATLGNLALSASGIVVTAPRIGTLNARLDDLGLQARGKVFLPWTTEARRHQVWARDMPGIATSILARITENKNRRITEDDLVRIIEYLDWAIEPRLFNPWTTERGVFTGSDNRRRTEPGDRRITEASVVRALERGQIWFAETKKPVDIWTKE